MAVLEDVDLPGDAAALGVMCATLLSTAVESDALRIGVSLGSHQILHACMQACNYCTATSDKFDGQSPRPQAATKSAISDAARVNTGFKAAPV